MSEENNAMPKAIVKRPAAVQVEAKAAPAQATVARPVGYPQVITGMIGLAAVVVMLVGLGMALIPSSLDPYYSSAAALARQVLRVENGRMLAVVGAVLAAGAGISLTVQNSVAKVRGK